MSNINLKISSSPPALDNVDEYAKILFKIFNEGQNPDLICKGIFTKPYTRFDDYTSMENLQEPQYYCDKIEVINGEKIVQSYAWREWGVHAQKILACLENKKEKDTAGMLESLSYE